MIPGKISVPWTTRGPLFEFNSTSGDFVQGEYEISFSRYFSQYKQEEMIFMGPVRLHDVEEVQQRIVDIVHSLEEDGEIFISGKGGAEDVFVE